MADMTRRACRIVAVAFAAAIVAGCIQRTITIESDPSGALVHLNDEEVGRTPVTVPFTFYGTYDVRVEKDGYQTLNTPQKAEAEWFEAPGPDLFVELMPWTTKAELQWHFALDPLGPVSEEILLDHARQMRSLVGQETAGADDSEP